MSDVKPETPAAASVQSRHPDCEIQREDLRLDCLRLAAQRQGARDSRGLLEIAEEYYSWVTAESAPASAGDDDPQVAPAAVEWTRVRTAPVKRASTLSLGKKAIGVTTTAKQGGRKSRAASRE
ncbi:hypothetical protein [Denitrobaculum tricleocarpae]|uniref:Uncharacterized protein n=1 Tax=Denitrobaculum tricleocarpae TaxID=2591009 RepID=A0A545TUA4_9PROT|nr:hypothetical protein [Denitrobaculum tricleocarpae]TQV80792.1 hypothetical protein FKG95_11625 [Denitrobaculum tricleocarpae]